jgi:hypothetical protein
MENYCCNLHVLCVYYNVAIMRYFHLILLFIEFTFLIFYGSLSIRTFLPVVLHLSCVVRVVTYCERHLPFCYSKLIFKFSICTCWVDGGVLCVVASSCGVLSCLHYTSTILLHDMKGFKICCVIRMPPSIKQMLTSF